MSNILGKVFFDLNHDGTYDNNEQGIAGVVVVLYDVNSNTCSEVTTNVDGDYIFSNVPLGNYIVYETVVTQGVICPPTIFTQPVGYTVSNGPRSVDIEVTNINQNFSGINFSHDKTDAIIGCENRAVQFGTGGTATKYRWIDINAITGEFTIKGEFESGVQIGSIGHNILDGFIYGFDKKTLVRVDDDLNVTYMDFELPRNPFAGAFDENGYFYILDVNKNMYVIDINPNSPSYLRLVDSTNGYQVSDTSVIMSQDIRVPDWAYNVNDDNLYGILSGDVVRYNPVTGVVTILTTAPLVQGIFTSAFSDANGFIYVLNNGGEIYRITTVGDDATLVFLIETDAPPGRDGTMCIEAVLEMDFGDAPDISAGNSSGDYSTLLANNGPRHQIINELFIGASVTSESDALQNATATGDVDDGVVLPLSILTDAISYDVDVTVTNNTGKEANLYGWIDFNNDGIFQLEEFATATVPSQVGGQVITLTFTPNVKLTVGDTFLRLRLTTDELINNGGLDDEDLRSLGVATDGEVEDHIISVIQGDTLDLTKTQSKECVDIGDVITYTIIAENKGTLDVEFASVQDIIPEGATYVENTLTVNGVSSAEDPNVEILLPILIEPADSLIIEFDVLVESIPPDDKLENIATGKFEVEEIPKTALSNEIIAIVKHAELEVEKSADVEIACVGEIIKYTSIIENIGNVVAENVIFTDDIPLGTSFIVDTVYINDVKVGLIDPAAGINLSNIDPGSSIKVSFAVEIIDTIPNPIQNISKVEYSYEVDPLEPDINKEADSNNVLVNVIDPLTKTANRECVTVGDVITYTIAFDNDTNFELYDIIVKDLLEANIEFILGTVKVNGMPMPNLNILEGINLGVLGQNNISVIEFDVKVIGTDNNIIKNTSTSTFKYISNDIEKIKEVHSNEVTVKVEKNEVTVSKIADKSVAILDDIIMYRTVVTNSGDVEVLNIIFKDILPPSLEFVTDSFEVNGIKVNDVDLELGVNIGSLDPGESATVDYKAKVISGSCSYYAKNEAFVEYTYRLSNNVSGYGISNIGSVCVELAISSFKTVDIDKIFKIPCMKPDVEEIDCVDANVTFENSYVVKVINSKSVEGQILSGNKLIIHGFIEVILEYTALNCSQSINSAHYKVPFSTFVILSNNYIDDENVELLAKIENIDYDLLSCREFAMNLTMLIIASVKTDKNTFC